jgi:hypothetical protein
LTNTYNGLEYHFLAGYCHLVQLWVALGLPPSPRARARATTPRTDRGLPAALSSALWPLSTLANSSTVANRLTKDCYLATSGNQHIFSKSPMYFDVFFMEFLTLRSSASSHRPHSLNTMNNSTQPVVCESSCLT